MLVLTRRVGETLYIGDNIKVTVLSAHRDSIRVGIDAPKDVLVLREEVKQRAEGVKKPAKALDSAFDTAKNSIDTLMKPAK
ncbi:MAG TPA: carbon storage regulator CsrA [Methanosarcina sp.]|nr:carbon storage regulator CsrA [Methanosarcina sp.]